MRLNAVARGLTAASLCAALVAWFRWESAEQLPAPVRVENSPAPIRAAVASDSALADAEDLTVANDPFRLSNTPASVRYDPANDGNALGLASASPPPLRPTLILKAIVGGPPWQAVIDGIPGQPPGTVVREGTRFDKLNVRAVTRDSVIVQGPDTAWVLSFRGRS